MRLCLPLCAALLLLPCGRSQDNGLCPLRDNAWNEQICCWQEMAQSKPSRTASLRAEPDPTATGNCIGPTATEIYRDIGSSEDCLRHCMSLRKEALSQLQSDCNDDVLPDLHLPAEAEEGAKIAFLITAHTDLLQLVRLFKSIYHPTIGYYWINIDNPELKASFDGALGDLLHKGKGDKGSHVSVSHRPIKWGDNSMMRVMMLGISELLDMATDWSYLINLSGTDYPLRPVASMQRWLATNGQGHNFVTGMEDIETSPHMGWRPRAVNVWGYNSEGRYTTLENVQREGLPQNISFRGGFSWWTLHRSFCHFICSDSPLPRLLLQLGDTMGNNDEVYIQTVLANSPFCHTVRDGTAVVLPTHRLVSWGDAGESPSHPSVLGMQHWETVKGGEAFFARKFSSNTSHELLHRIETELWPMYPDQPGEQQEKKESAPADPMPSQPSSEPNFNQGTPHHTTSK